MATKIQVRRDTNTNWSTINPILAAGEFGYDTTNNTLKLGDGATRWNALSEFVDTDFDFDEIPTYVRKAGDTMTGQLTLPGGGTGSQAATVDEVNTAVTSAAYVGTAGDNMTGPLTIGPEGGTALTTLDDDGSAEFSNTVIVDGPNSGVASLLVRSNWEENTGNQVFLVRGNTDNDLAWINGDGSVNFEGVVTSPSFDAGGAYTSANAIVARATGNNNGAGAVRASNNTPSGATFVGLSTNESTTVFRVDNTGIVVQRGLLFETEPDNDDNYTTTTEEYTETESYTGPLGNTLVREVTKTRELRTYTGPTLDVRAVLQDLQQRVADRDAVIASFATRLAQLEADHATLMGNSNEGY